MPLSLNRLFTITGSGIATRKEFPVYYWDRGRETRSNAVGTAEYAALDADGDNVGGTMLSDVQGAAKIRWQRSYVTSEGQPSTVTSTAPFNGDDRAHLWLVGENRQRLIQWETPNPFEPFFSFFGTPALAGFDVEVQSGMLLVPDQSLDTDGLFSQRGPGFQFSNIFANVTTGEETTRKVWGRLVELGEAAGLVQITSDLESAEDVAFSAQSRAFLRTRFYDNIRFATEVIDDEGTIWDVSGVRAMADRRFLELQLFRTIVQSES